MSVDALNSIKYVRYIQDLYESFIKGRESVYFETREKIRNCKIPFSKNDEEIDREKCRRIYLENDAMPTEGLTNYRR